MAGQVVGRMWAEVDAVVAPEMGAVDELVSSVIKENDAPPTFQELMDLDLGVFYGTGTAGPNLTEADDSQQMPVGDMFSYLHGPEMAEFQNAAIFPDVRGSGHLVDQKVGAKEE